MLESDCITPSFGLDFALRTVDPSTVTELTHTRLDSRAYTDRSSTARGQHVRAFDLDQYGEIFTRVVGRALETGLKAELNPRIRKARPRISGADSLKVHLALGAAHLIDDLRAIGARLDAANPVPGFEAISYVRRLAASDPKVSQLDQVLAASLHSSQDFSRIAFTAPSQLLDKHPECDAFRISLGRGFPVSTKPFLVEEVTLDTFQDHLDTLPAESRLGALGRAKIQMMSDVDGGAPVGPATDALKWLAAEITLDNAQYFRHENKWYAIGADHLRYVREEIGRIFAESQSFGLPAWPTKAEALALRLKDSHEKGYNAWVAARRSWALLDRDLITCRLHPQGFEAADLVTPGGALIHVKLAEGSAPVSHLFVQGLVSADALHTEGDANQAFVAKVTAQLPGFPQGIFTPRRVVFAIALKTGAELTPERLFTVSQISLLHTARALRNMGVDVQVQGIDYRRRGAEERAEQQAKKAVGRSAA